MPLHQIEWKETNLFVITKVCMCSDLICLGDSAYMLSLDVDGFVGSMITDPCYFLKLADFL